MSQPVATLETERLLLRPLTLADAVQAQPLFARWEIVRLLSAAVPWPFPADGVEAFYRDVALPAMGRGEQWHWTIRLKAQPDRLIGAISLIDKPQPVSHINNRGFWIGLPWQGCGYATEACRIVTAYWFDVLGFPLLTVPKAAANVASSRISQKTGMTLLRTELHDFVAGTMPAEIWQLTAEQWRATRHLGEQDRRLNADVHR